MRGITKWGAVGGLAAAVLLAGAVGGIAQDKLAAVKARQDFMKGQGADVKAIVGFAKGNGTQPAALKAVDDLLARAPKINDQFPAGTSATDFPGKTHAKPEIWTDWDKVKMISTTVQSEEEKLKAAIQKGDKAAVSAQIGALNKNGCGACHGHYRLPYS